MNTILVGFGHKLRSGKDTAVAAIIEQFGGSLDVRRCAFADALKREVNQCIAAYGGNVEVWLAAWRAIPPGGHRVPDWVTPDSNPDMSDPLCPLGKHRKILQWYGTEYRRAQDPDYWVKRLAETIEREKPQFALISDVRFKNELAWIKDSGGYTVKVSRRGFTPDAGDHASERDLDDAVWDFHIAVPDGALEDLKRSACWTFGTITTTHHPLPSQIFADHFREFQSRCHKTAVEHGWWDEPNPNAGEKIALMHTELSEALEWIRNGNGASDHIPAFSGLEEELADCIIRIVDFAGHLNLDLPGALLAKAEYNAGRPYKHGGKAF